MQRAGAAGKSGNDICEVGLYFRIRLSETPAFPLQFHAVGFTGRIAITAIPSDMADFASTSESGVGWEMNALRLSCGCGE